jgi:Asp-tRNA(Asn)/Glu-tRNA(Gln) amidotransferase A subunit family amidase
MPTSMHIVGNLYGEAAILALAKAYQGRTPHHQRQPEVD